MKQFQTDGRSIILVTHALDLVRDLCDRAVMLEAGDVVVDGTPRDAVRRFRERYASQALDVEGEREWGTRDVQVVACAVTDGHGVPKEEFAPGEDFGIEIDVEAGSPIDEPLVGFEIRNHMDLLIYGLHTGLQGVPLGRLHGRRRVQFRCRDLPLVVLTDSATRDSAVLLAAALQQHRHALVVGEPVHGAGWVMESIKLPEGLGMLRLPTGVAEQVPRPVLFFLADPRSEIVAGGRAGFVDPRRGRQLVDAGQRGLRVDGHAARRDPTTNNRGQTGQSDFQATSEGPRPCSGAPTAAR